MSLLVASPSQQSVQTVFQTIRRTLSLCSFVNPALPFSGSGHAGCDELSLQTGNCQLSNCEVLNMAGFSGVSKKIKTAGNVSVQQLTFCSSSVLSACSSCFKGTSGATFNPGKRGSCFQQSQVEKN